MKRLLMVALALVLLAPVADADETPSATLLLGGPLPLAGAAVEALCDGADVVAGDTLSFEATGPVSLQPRTSSTVCGRATLNLTLAPPASALAIGFSATASGSVPGQLPSWRLEVHDRDGATVAAIDGGTGDFTLEAPAQGATLAWTFTVPMLLPGQEFSLTIADVSYTREVKLATTSSLEREYRAGTLRVEETRVVVDLGDAFADDARGLMISVGDQFRFAHLVLPDGSRVERSTTAQSGDAVRLERASGLLTVHVPGAMINDAGGGAYQLVARATYTLEPNPALTPLAIVLLALPFTLAVMAERAARAFEREAFGHFALAARRLRLGTLLVTIFYAVVFVAALVGGRAPLMTVWPLNLEGWLLYAQAVVAIAAFLGLHVAARQLRKIVTPPAVE